MGIAAPEGGLKEERDIYTKNPHPRGQSPENRLIRPWTYSSNDSPSKWHCNPAEKKKSNHKEKRKKGII